MDGGHHRHLILPGAGKGKMAKHLCLPREERAKSIFDLADVTDSSAGSGYHVKVWHDSVLSYRSLKLHYSLAPELTSWISCTRLTYLTDSLAFAFTGLLSRLPQEAALVCLFPFCFPEGNVCILIRRMYTNLSSIFQSQNLESGNHRQGA